MGEVKEGAQQDHGGGGEAGPQGEAEDGDGGEEGVGPAMEKLVIEAGPDDCAEEGAARRKEFTGGDERDEKQPNERNGSPPS